MSGELLKVTEGREVGTDHYAQLSMTASLILRAHYHMVRDYFSETKCMKDDKER